MHVSEFEKVADLTQQLKRQITERGVIANLEIKMTGVTSDLREIGRAAMLAEIDRKVGLIKSHLNILGVATD